MWNRMPPEAQNEMIAKLSGGVLKPCTCGVPGCHLVHGKRWHWAAAGGQITDGVPDYIGSLDLMHEVLRYHHARDEHFVEKFLLQLALVLSDGETSDYAHVGKWELITADSHQRAKALILTLMQGKKWGDL